MTSFKISLLASFLAFTVQAQSTKLEIYGIKSNKGQIVINVFKSSESYEEGKPFKKLLFEKKNILDGKMNISFMIEPGVYGFTMIDDENKNGEVDKNFVSIPKEGFGFSNFFMEKLKKPSFDDFKVNIKSPEDKIRIKVKYM